MARSTTNLDLVDGRFGHGSIVVAHGTGSHHPAPRLTRVIGAMISYPGHVQSPGQALIATKLSPPETPSGFVVRSRLAEQLGAAIDDRSALVLVSAPAGSGKSTLLAGWLADGAHDVEWVQIDERSSSGGGERVGSRAWLLRTASSKRS